MRQLNRRSYVHTRLFTKEFSSERRVHTVSNNFAFQEYLGWRTLRLTNWQYAAQHIDAICICRILSTMVAFNNLCARRCRHRHRSSHSSAIVITLISHDDFREDRAITTSTRSWWIFPLFLSVLLTQMRGVSHSFSQTYDAFLAQKDAERNEDSSLFDVCTFLSMACCTECTTYRQSEIHEKLGFLYKKKHLLTALFCNRNWILGFLAIYSKAVLSFSKLLVS